jgi:hypothetical protein
MWGRGVGPGNAIYFLVSSNVFTFYTLLYVQAVIYITDRCDG